MSRSGRAEVGRWLLLLIVLLLIAWALLASFDVSPDGRGGWAVEPSLDNYREMVAGSLGLGPATVQGLLVSSVAAVLAAAFAFGAATGLRQVGAPWARHAPVALLFLSLIPPVAYGASLVDVARLVHLFDSPPGLVLIEAGLVLPLGLWILAGYLARLPRDVEEAALLDGCGPLGVLWRILLPTALPGVLATLVVLFVICWNLFTIPSLLSFRHIQTVPIVLSSFVSYEKELEWPPAAASLIIGLLPALLAIALAQRALRELAPLATEEQR